MLNCSYRLIAPRTIQPVLLQVDAADRVVVRPTNLSICNADQRYYQGVRSEEVLRKKLPMALIHEGIGRVVSDQTGEHNCGDLVVMIPNEPSKQDLVIAENYLSDSKFRGSGFDGFMQELVVLSPDRVIPLPRGIDADIAAFTELVSVAMHAIRRFMLTAHCRRRRVGIWGDGNVGYIVALLLHYLLPDTELFVVGRNSQKLADFTFVSDIFLASEMPVKARVDHAFECCGGEGSASAIEQIIEHIEPEGTVSLLGVVENSVPINTRMVLEKGLRFVGNSRSGRVDFVQVVELYRKHPDILDYLSSLIGHIHAVSNLQDIQTAFEVDMRKPMGKTIMQWNM